MTETTSDEFARWYAARTQRLTEAVTRWYGSPDGARAEAESLLSRHFDTPDHCALLVVDAALVAVSTAEGPGRGVVEEVWVEPDRRRQGQGSAALRVGVRWLAERGCAMAVTTIDAADPASQALTRGWDELSHRMELELTEPPELPPDFNTRPMTQDELAPWVRSGMDGFAESLVASGAFDRAGARAEAERDYATLLPDGTVPESATVAVVESAGRRVGVLWLAHHRPGTRTFIYDIEIDADERGRGFGRAAMHTAERIALERGDQSIGLNVFGYNDVARRLYSSLGYRVTDRSLGLTL